MHLHIISRADAKRAGLKYYFTGKPCNNGHISLRRETNARCAQCKIDEYYANKERYKASSKNYRENNKEKKRAVDKAYKDANKDRIRESSKRYRSENHDKVIAKQKECYFSKREYYLQKSLDYYKANSEVIRKRIRDYSAKNKNLISERSRNNSARRKGADGSHTNKDILHILESQKNKCANCLCDVSSRYHVDHIMPLKLGGTNWPHNLQILCPTCNLRKNAKHPIDWARENGRLL